VAWQLEIHHIDVSKNGDSTLIIARQVAPIGPGPAIRSVLIDGGLQLAGNDINAYIAMQLGGANLDAIICTHYDQDHMNGLTALLRIAVARYNNVFIYDQGWPGNAGADDLIIRYLKAINGRTVAGVPIAALAGANRTRVTSTVRSDAVPPGVLPIVGGQPAAPPGGAAGIVNPPHWLLSNPLAPQDPLWHGAAIPAPPGAPTMRFIAANGYVRTPAGGVVGPILGQGIDPKNEMSLAVEVRFGNFRYYAGGDLETAQENSIQTLLNNANNAAGRVLAFKVSHHGAATATSQGFVDQLMPTAAFISCGTENKHYHPFFQTINTLDGFPANPVLHGPPPPPAEARAVMQYLTGYDDVGPPLASYGGTFSLTAGQPAPPAPPVPGHIVLRVNAAQSAAPVRGRLFTAVQTAVQAVLTTPGLGGVMTVAAAAPIALAAAEEAMRDGAAYIAAWLITHTGGPVAASVATFNAANGPLAPGIPAWVMARTVSSAALLAGVTAARAAAAGAAAGTCLGAGMPPSVQNAIGGALVGALLPGGIPAATAIGIAAVPAVAPVQFSVRLWWQLNPAGAGNVTVFHS
jgi:beta-lactamase superfamily II metal-dependent hydrolase